ncbi:MAG: folate-binding protein, partial [Mariprofundaceae bacterium]|nr:folate-binding protein [Mariprofundaceae bacterium]
RGGIKKKLYRILLPDISKENIPASLPCPVHSIHRVGELRALAFDHTESCYGMALLPIETVIAGSPLRLENGAPLTVLEACHA